ncbi:MAG: hypothetical protein NVSMB4_05600 [Acidimicrobiales bacterium]
MSPPRSRRWGGGILMRAIAEILNEKKVPTSQGDKRWYASTVQQTLTRVGRDV